ncbi:MAG TPA: hypothetical protein PLQ75_10515, partial [Anaerolineales bacterium]|nr:hypothetical protein [Anaerolineales bacterium]
MRKIFLLTLLLIFSLACSLGTFAPQPTATPAPTQTDTATPLPTPTPVTPTLTFTSTPTLISNTAIPTIETTSTELSTPTATQALATPYTVMPPVNIKGFISITISLTEVFKAKGCEPSVVRVTAQVANPNDVSFVLLFSRFKSLKAERTGKWTTVQMIPLGAGTYIFDLSSALMKDDAYFEN